MVLVYTQHKLLTGLDVFPRYLIVWTSCSPSCRGGLNHQSPQVSLRDRELNPLEQRSNTKRSISVTSRRLRSRYDRPPGTLNLDWALPRGIPWPRAHLPTGQVFFFSVWRWFGPGEDFPTFKAFKRQMFTEHGGSCQPTRLQDVLNGTKNLRGADFSSSPSW